MTDTKLKPFDLTAALAGAPVVTRDGRKVLQIAHFPMAAKLFAIVVVVEDNDFPTTLDANGKYMHDLDREVDLFMAPVKRTVWVTMYRHDCREIYSGVVGNTKEETMRFSSAKNHIGTYPLEIEE